MINQVSFLVSVITLGCLLGVPMADAILAPKKASDLRTILGNSNTSAECAGFGFEVDQQQNPDGTVEPFVIPEKKVFIVTSWDWEVFGPDSQAGSSRGAQLFIEGVGGELAVVSRGNATADSGGDASGIVETPTGVAVRPPGKLCFAAGSDGGFIVVHGFFAKDK